MNDVAGAKAAAGRFLAARGDERLRRCSAALLGSAPLADALATLGEPDADTTNCLRLIETLDDLRALDGPLAERTVTALVALQRPDGSWGSPVETGLVAGHLAKTPFIRSGPLEAAGDFLAARWSPERVKGGDWLEIAAYASYFANARHESGDAVLNWCGRELDRGFRTGTFDAVRTARVLVYCDARAMPGARLVAAEVVEALLAQQDADGSWPDAVERRAEAGPPDAAVPEHDRRLVAARTFEGLVALTRLA